MAPQNQSIALADSPASTTREQSPPLVRALILVQVVGVVVFLIGLLGALVYQDELRESFRSTINDNLARSIAGRISLAEEAITTPLAQKYLASHQMEVIREEIRLYRKDSIAYVSYLTGGGALDQRRQLDESSSNPVKRAFLEKVIGWRAAVKSRFDSSFERIGRDVCIFLGSNIAALLIAIFLAVRGKRYSARALTVSVILTVAVALAAFAYVDRNWVYAFLRNNWAVLGYPISLLSLLRVLDAELLSRAEAEVRSNYKLQRSGGHWGRTVCAMDGAREPVRKCIVPRR